MTFIKNSECSCFRGVVNPDTTDDKISNSSVSPLCVSYS